MHGLDLTALEIFRTVAVEGSVTRAAAKLNRVQSNISTRIKQLERQLEKDLFRRQNRGLTLTPDGELLLAYADRFLQLSMEASEALNSGRPAGNFRIGTMESTAAARLPAILSQYHRLYPEVAIEVETDTAAVILDRLRDGDVEAAFVAEPVECEWIETVPVFVESLVLVVPQSYLLPLEPDALVGKTMLAFEAGCAYRRYLENWLLESGVAPGTILSLGSYVTILACVSAGTGFAVVPQSVLDTFAVRGGFHSHPLPGRYSRIITQLGWRPDYQSAKLAALKALLPAV